MVCIKRFVLFRHSLYFGVEWIFKSMICNCLDAGSLQIGLASKKNHSNSMLDHEATKNSLKSLRHQLQVGNFFS